MEKGFIHPTAEGAEGAYVGQETQSWNQEWAGTKAYIGLLTAFGGNKT